MSKRLLVTGSRDWTDQLAIVKALWDAHAELSPGTITLVHGACPTGADHIADMVWSTNQHPVERHPAERYGRWPACGPIRNKAMVDLGADLCLAFINPCTSRRCVRRDVHDSHGAAHCVTLAIKAGIPVRVFRP